MDIGPEFNLVQLDFIGEELQKIAADEAEVMLGITIVSGWADKLRMTLVSMNEHYAESSINEAQEKLSIKSGRKFYGRIK